jgi:hypothetical protein
MSARGPTRSYQGTCHCQAIRFVFESEEIVEGRRCNCSICIRKGAVVSARYYEPHEFEITKGRDALGLYRFGDHMVNHYFCKHCGIYPFHDGTGEYQGRDYRGRYRVNLGCVDGVDVLALKIEILDGRSF